MIVFIGKMNLCRLVLYDTQPLQDVLASFVEIWKVHP
jgi:hypothetical protein